MKFPTKVKVHGVWWKIIVTDDANLVERGELGKCHYDKLLIAIRVGQVLDSAWTTLLHELFHAMNSQLSELDVDWLANTTWAVLKENKWLK